MIISILCGGSGTRLWPLSRELLPKQFAPILPKNLDSENSQFSQSAFAQSQRTLFAQTLKRNEYFVQKEGAKFSVITNDKHYFLASDIANYENFHISSYILESHAKNTAPALLFEALNVAQQNDEEIILALPSDHLIQNTQGYIRCVKKAQELADKGFLVTFGIKPTKAHTGYGYIKSKDGIVEQFVEKPDAQTAQKYLQSGQYFWNSGMFCFKAKVFIKEFEACAPELFEACKRAFLTSHSAQNTTQNAQNNKWEILRILPQACENLPEISIDYALMEKSSKAACVESEFEWSDVGGFDALKELWESDESGNASSGELVSLDSKNNFVISEKPVAAVEIENLAIINSSDCLLIAPLDKTQRIKEVVSKLKLTHPQLTQIHSTAHRPWGTYSVLLEGANYKIKQIMVKPSHRLSLQKHFHRNEHWVVVSGSAIVRLGDKEVFLKANESTYIPMGEVHRLENPGKIPLVLIEVQTGEYLGEDDIIRYEDNYSREQK